MTHAFTLLSQWSKFMLKVSSCIHKYPPVWAKDSPGKVALIHPESGRQLMYRQLLKEIDKKAQGLINWGIKPGDRVASILPLGLETVILLYACAKVGAIYVPLGLGHTISTYRNRLVLARPSLVFFSEEPSTERGKTLAESLIALSPEEVALIQLHGIDSSDSGQITSWDSFWKRTHSWRQHLPHSLAGHLLRSPKDIHAWSPVLLLFDNLSEKAVLLCHENIVSQTLNLHTHTQLQRSSKALVNQAVEPIHTYVHGICSTLTLGGTVVLTQKEEPTYLCGLIDSYCISHMIQYPGQYEALWSIFPPRVGRPPSLQYALYVVDPRTAHFPSEAFHESLHLFSRRYGSGLFYPEAGGFISFCNQILLEKSQRLAFAPYLIHEDNLLLTIREGIRIDGGCGSPLPLEKPGWICVHPPNVFLGYFHDPKETGKILSKEGILYTSLEGHIRTYKQEKLLFINKSAQFSQPLELHAASAG